MNGTVKQFKISFPEQNRPGIFLGYQKSRKPLPLIKFRYGFDKKYTVTGYSHY